MDIGLSDDPSHYNKSEEEEYFESLLMSYIENEHILLVRRIRSAKNEKEAVRIYYKGLRKTSISFTDFCWLSAEKQKIAIKNLQKLLSQKGIPYLEFDDRGS